MRAVEQGRKVFDNLNKFIRYVIIELVAYIITFLGASILNIAAGQPFSPSQILYINFPGQRTARRRARHGQRGSGADDPQTAVPRCDDHDEGPVDHRRSRRLVHGRVHPGVDQLRHQPLRQPGDRFLDGTDGVLAVHHRGRLPSTQRHGVRARRRTLDNRNLNWTAAAELVLAVLITQWEVLRRIFGTVELTLAQWSPVLVPAVLLFFVWELGKVIARRSTNRSHREVPA
jgi:Ca2+-transporting ATPase